MNDDTRQLERLLHDTLAATMAAAPSEVGAWQRFQARRRRRATAIRAGTGLAFAAIVGAAVLLPTWVGGHGTERSVAPATAPVNPTPVNPEGPGPIDNMDPAGRPLTVASGTVAGRTWTYEIYRSVGGQLCTRWGAYGAGSCGIGPFMSAGANPYYDKTGTKGIGTAIDGTMPPRTVLVRVELRGRKAVELPTTGAREFGVAAYATVLPSRGYVTRITAYDARGKVVFDDRHPHNTPWPGEPDKRP